MLTSGTRLSSLCRSGEPGSLCGGGPAISYEEPSSLQCSALPRLTHEAQGTFLSHRIFRRAHSVQDHDGRWLRLYGTSTGFVSSPVELGAPPMSHCSQVVRVCVCAGAGIDLDKGQQVRDGVSTLSEWLLRTQTLSVSSDGRFCVVSVPEVAVTRRLMVVFALERRLLPVERLRRLAGLPRLSLTTPKLQADLRKVLSCISALVG